jgi:hypothetical protein
MDYYMIPQLPGGFAGAHPIEANTVIPGGGLVALNAAGNAVPASSTVTGFAIGIAEEGVDNTGGAAAAKKVTVRRGVFSCALDATNPPNKTHIGGRVWVTAPDTVSSLNTVTCRGGILLGFGEDGRALVNFDASVKTAGL